MSGCVGRVLVIEDEPLLRISIRDALQKEGWTVDVAEDDRLVPRLARPDTETD